MLLFGIGVRWISVPLMVTMLVATFKVHWHNGWQAIADTSVCLFNCGDAQAAAERLRQAREILQTHGNYDWLTEQGNFVISNNGVEFAITYFIMLLALLFIGAGKYVSVDYWIGKHLFPKTA
jgi:putative oxidoreductase